MLTTLSIQSDINGLWGEVFGGYKDINLGADKRMLSVDIARFILDEPNLKFLKLLRLPLK